MLFFQMLSVQLQNINNTVSLLKTLTFDTVVGLYIVYDMWYSQAMVNGMSRAFQFVKKTEMTHLEILNIHNNVERYYIIDKYVIFWLLFTFLIKLNAHFQ